jgi:hypothetical protein
VESQADPRIGFQAFYRRGRISQSFKGFGSGASAKKSGKDDWPKNVGLYRNPKRKRGPNVFPRLRFLKLSSFDFADEISMAEGHFHRSLGHRPRWSKPKPICWLKANLTLQSEHGLRPKLGEKALFPRALP